MTKRKIEFEVDELGAFKCKKAVIGGNCREMKGQGPFKEFSANYVFEPNVRILVKLLYKRTGTFPLDS